MTCTVLALAVTVDGEHRVRGDRIERDKHAIWRARDRAIGGAVQGARGVGRRLRGMWRPAEARAKAGNVGERQALLDGDDS